MRIASVVPLLSALLTLGAGQAPTAPPAALKRPHLQVLTKVPESQLFPMMNAIADSLGVRCDFCHVRNAPDPTKSWSLAGGWIWDRDDKAQKLKARDEMRMVAEINARQFGGRGVVSCYTCHRGSVAPATFPPLPPREYSTAPEPAAPPLPSAEDVWSAYLKAVGATRRFATTVMSATDDRSEGRHGTFEVVFKGSDRARATLRMPPDGPASQALNGESGWIAGDNGSRDLRPDEVPRLRRATQRYAVVKIDRPANLRIAGRERIRARDVYVAVSEVDAQTKLLLSFDALTGLLLRERTTTETSFIPLQQQFDYEDYRNVDGVMLPFVIRSSDGAPFSTSVKVFTSIRHDVEVDDAMFQRPQPPAAQPTPATQQAPAAQKAGERFKSVRMLADMPATLMIPTMAFIANSLGVTCLHCHTDVYESDEKAMKQKAREMIRMTRAINDTQFGGKREVTCQTCHNGRAVPTSTPSMENAGWNKPPRAPDAPLPDVAAVLQKYAAAVGMGALDGLQNQRLVGTITRNSGRTPPVSEPFELYQEKPRTFRLTTALSHPPEADVELPMTFLRPPLLQSTYPDLRITGRDRIGGDRVVVATGTSARGTHQLYFSESSGLLVRRGDEIETPLGAVPEFYDFADFERVDGWMVPKKIVWSRADYQVTFGVSQIAHK